MYIELLICSYIIFIISSSSSSSGSSSSSSSEAGATRACGAAARPGSSFMFSISKISK